MADLHLISYEPERDLVPLILSNCQYSMEKGGETLQDFDLEKIQQQIVSKFLQGKPLITLTVGQGSSSSRRQRLGCAGVAHRRARSVTRAVQPWASLLTGHTHPRIQA